MWDFSAPAGLTGFARSSSSVALWRRPPLSDFRVLVDCIRGDLAEFRQVLAPGAVKHALAAAFPARFWRSSLARPWVEDVTELATMFCQEAGSAQCCVNLDCTRRMEHFRTDLEGLQLLCSYRGPGISWLAEDNVDSRVTGGWPYRDEDIVLRPHEVYASEERDVLVLKGRRSNTAPVYYKGPARRLEQSGSWLLRLSLPVVRGAWCGT